MTGLTPHARVNRSPMTRTYSARRASAALVQLLVEKRQQTCGPQRQHDDRNGATPAVSGS